MIIINTKNYKQGEALLKLATMIEHYNLHTLIAVPASELYHIAAKTALNVYAQHVDYARSEKSSGHMTATDVRAAGASGTLLNHSEHPLSFDVLKKTVAQCKQAHLVTVVCAASLSEAQKIAQLKPSVIAFEDPKLVGTGKSITKTRAHDIEKFVAHLKGKPIVPLCGAGISSVADVKAAYALGCKGVVISSAIANTKRPDFFLEELATFTKEQDA